MTGFTAKVLRQSGNGFLYLITGRQHHKPGWCYARIAPEKLPLFLEAIRQPAINVSLFGTVLFSGDGSTPPADIQQMIVRYDKALNP